MKWNNVSLTIIITLWIPLFSSASLNNDVLFEKGDSLFSQQKYHEAIIDFERVIFDGCDQKVFAEVLIRKSACHKQLGEYEKAIHELFRIDMNRLESPIRNKLLYEISLCFYLDEKPDFALAYFRQISDIKNDNLKLDVSLLGMLLMNDMFYWERAKKYANEFLRLKIIEASSCDSLIMAINEIYDPKKTPKLKNEKTARTLSFIIPGLGQTYAGYPFDGLLSLALCAGSLYAGTLLFQSGMYYTGSAGGVGMFIKFYFGGIERTTFLVNKKNNKKANQFKNRVEELVLNL